MDNFTRYSFDSDGGLGQALERHRTATEEYVRASSEVERFNKVYLFSWQGDEPITKGERIAHDKVERERAARVQAVQKAMRAVIETSQAVAAAWNVLRTSVPH